MFVPGAVPRCARALTGEPCADAVHAFVIVHAVPTVMWQLRKTRVFILHACLAAPAPPAQGRRTQRLGAPSRLIRDRFPTRS